MADKSNTAPFGEISTIRDILMGEQMNEYNSRFQEMETRLAAAQEELEAKVNALHKQQEEALRQLREEVFQKLEQLSHQLSDKSQTLEEKIEATASSDRTRLGAMLKELGQQLTGNE